MTDRTLKTREALAAIAFDTDGLVPVVAQDAASGAVLMVAWANLEALTRTLDTGALHFWSRSRRSLWRKGETSGNSLAVVSLHADCDGDAVLARVRPSGPACHTGETTCFGSGAEGSGAVLGGLWSTLADRERRRPPGSYTVRLLDDDNLRLKKLGEETAELVASLAREDRKGAAGEAADLVYHLMVALLGAGVEWSEVERLLAERAG